MKALHIQDLLITIGNNLHTIRNVRKETLQNVAHAIGISHPVISKIENGRSENLTLNLLISLCNHYEVSLQQILSLEISQIFQLNSNHNEGEQRLIGQEVADGYKDEIKYLRSLVEKYIIQK